MMMAKMKHLVSECESKKVAKKTDGSGCEIAGPNGICPGSNSTLSPSDVGQVPDNVAGKIEIQSVKFQDVDLGRRKKPVSNSGGRGTAQ